MDAETGSSHTVVKPTLALDLWTRVARVATVLVITLIRRMLPVLATQVCPASTQYIERSRLHLLSTLSTPPAPI